MMKTRVHIPSRSALSNYVTALFETSRPGISRELILPKGVVEIIFNLGGPAQGILPHHDTATPAPNCFLQGMNTYMVDVAYSGQQHLFGICLQPHMVKKLLGILPSECKNTLLDLTLIEASFKSLWHQLKEAAGFKERVSIIEKAFPALSESNCTRTQHFCQLFSASTPQYLPSIDILSKQLCYSSRQLNRKAQDIFGISTEELLIHKKFRDSVAFMHNGKRTLTDIAYEAGFYDQAHFCRTFKNFTGFTAKQYQSQKSELPFHIYF